MSKGLIKVAEGCELIAEGLREMAANTKPVPQKPEKAEKGVETEAPIKEQETKVTVETVRAVLAEKSRAGKTQEVRTLLNEFGADRLSAVPEEKLGDLLKKAEAL